MKNTLLIKALAAVLVLIGCVVAQRVNAEIIRVVTVNGVNGQVLNTYNVSDVDYFECGGREVLVTVHGANGQVLNTYDVSDVDYFEFGEREVVYPFAEFASDNKDNIVFHLAPGVKFKMIKVQGASYALQESNLGWSTEKRTRTLSDYYIAEFECTQGLWMAVKGSLPSNQTATGDDMPVAMVPWDMIMGSADDTFLKLLNAKMPQIRANSSADVVAALGNKEFRLPNEWEWEYAAAGGKDWANLKYTYSGTTGTGATVLNTVAVNSVSPNTASSVAVVGSKLPNNLGLYDMSGNVREWCSGLGYSDYETTAGYLTSGAGTWLSSSRPFRGGSWNYTVVSNFLVSFRNYGTSTITLNNIGFRVAL
ncbi:MAG: formylglycine-generating enzyme family protein [Muribaculaceae bacterium]|nr:formylglycine-generating enzyme family protein [Muribaculaceae bacterium]